MRLLVVFAMLVWAAFAANAQQTYRWVDKDGKVHYTQTPPPADAAKSVQRKSFGSGAAPSIELPYSSQVAMRNHPVTLYTTPDCGKPCGEGRGHLEQRGVPFKEVSVTDEKGRAELQGIAGKLSVPVLVVGKDVQNGFEAEAWKDSLDAAGYPASVPRFQQPAAARKAAEAPRAAPSEKLAVSLYTGANCGMPCNNARQLLAGRSVPFQEIAVDTPEKAEELSKISGETTVPTLVVGSTVQKGFEASLYNSALDAGGYAPRAAAKR